ncbi:MAG: response regulator [Burkholderiales bacterium]|nr:response regulator [Burkholderiales bacterium]
MPVEASPLDTTPTVYVVDDDPSIRELLAWLMKSNGIAVATFANAQLFLKSYQAGAPGCLIVDLYMPGMSGLELQHYLIEHDLVIPVVFLSARADIAKAVAAVKHGAIDFIEKPFDYKKIVALAQDCLFRDQLLRGARGNIDAKHARLALLTLREREVMHRVISGKINRVIAEELSIGVKTVEAHRAKIMEKLEVNSLAELVQIAMQPLAK